MESQPGQRTAIAYREDRHYQCMKRLRSRGPSLRRAPAGAPNIVLRGPGLPLGHADQIFDAFFTTKPQGSGMGLAICKSIIESQGGRIWANDDGERGATSYFTLPAAPVETNPPMGLDEASR